MQLASLDSCHEFKKAKKKTRLQVRNCYNLADWERASGAQISAWHRTKEKINKWKTSTSFSFYQPLPLPPYLAKCIQWMTTNQSGYMRLLTFDARKQWRAIFSFLTQAPSLSGGGAEQRQPRIRIKTWAKIQDQTRCRSWIEMELLLYSFSSHLPWTKVIKYARHYEKMKRPR